MRSVAYRRHALFLSAVCFVAYGYFYQAGGWNQNSRFALVRAIVEYDTLRIDKTVRFEGRQVTGDYARCGRHSLCSDKAPGLSLAAVPVVVAARPFVAVPESRGGIATLSYAATLAGSALPTALAVFLLFGLARALGASLGGAAFGAAVFGLGTPAWAYATLFFGQALATFCLLAAFVAAVALQVDRGARRDFLLAASSGLAAGWGTITDYPTAIPAVIVFGLAVANAWPGGWPRRVRVAGAMAAGGVAALVVLLAYNQAAFGAPLSLGYGHVEGFAGMRTGFMGVTYPKLDVLGEITIGRYRGLLFLAPVLAAAPFGFVLLGRRAVTFAAAGIVVYYLLFNASYHYWSGGDSYGPRHMAPALPFLCLGLALVWTRATSVLRAPIAALALWGAALALVAVATNAMPPKAERHPVGDYLWPSFWNGDLSLNQQAFIDGGLVPQRDRESHMWNLGEKAGLDGKASLVPLFVLWGVLTAWWVTTGRSRRSRWRFRAAGS